MYFGFDLDEVVVDLTKEIEEYLLVTYGIKWPVDCFVKYDFVDCEFSENENDNLQIRNELISLVNNPEFQFTAKPVIGAREALQAMKKAGHKIYFITCRPKQNQPLTFRWLRQNGIPFDGLYVLGNSADKGRYAKLLKLDMYVDDLERHLESMWIVKNRWRKGLLLLDKPWNGAYIDGSKFTRVKNWQEILRHVGVQNR